jgi:hypothetical protein
MAGLACAVVAVLAATPARAASVSRSFANSIANVPPGSWGNEGLAASPNSSCAITLFGGTLALTDFRFGVAPNIVPAGSVITGVSVRAFATSPDASASLILAAPGGLLSSSRPITVVAGACGTAFVDSGGDGDLWGLSLTDTDVTDAAFGVRVAGIGDQSTTPFRLDGVTITVFFTPPPPPPPAAPTGLGAASQQNRVHLAWTDNSSDETSFSVERATGMGSFAEIGTSSQNVATFDDTTAQCNVEYSYKVRAFRQGDGVYSTYSGVATLTHVCPDLSVTKSTATPTVLVSQTWTWSLAITNGGEGTATFANTQRLLADTLPSGPASYGNVGVVLGGGASGPLSCSVASGILACTATGTVTVPVSGTVTVSVDGSSPSPAAFDNGGSNCAVDPDGALVETVEANNACNTSQVTVQALSIFGDGFESGTLAAWGGSSPP